MTALLTIIVLISIAVAIWQMVKIFDLANAGKETSPVATDKDNSWNAYFMLGFLIFIYNHNTMFCVLWRFTTSIQFSFCTWSRY